MAKRGSSKGGAKRQAAEADGIGSAAPREMIECRQCFDLTPKGLDDIRDGLCGSCDHIRWAMAAMTARTEKNKGVPSFVVWDRARAMAEKYNEGRPLKDYWNARHFVCKKCGDPYLEYIKIHDDGAVKPVIVHDYNEEYCVYCRSLRNCIAQAKDRKRKNEDYKRFLIEERERIEKEAAARRFKAAAGVKEPEDEIPF